VYEKEDLNCEKKPVDTSYYAPPDDNTWAAWLSSKFAKLGKGKPYESEWIIECDDDAPSATGRALLFPWQKTQEAGSLVWQSGEPDPMFGKIDCDTLGTMNRGNCPVMIRLVPLSCAPLLGQARYSSVTYPSIHLTLQVKPGECWSWDYYPLNRFRFVVRRCAGSRRARSLSDDTGASYMHNMHMQHDTFPRTHFGLRVATPGGGGRFLVQCGDHEQSRGASA
jgi:hypothetical protein